MNQTIDPDYIDGPESVAFDNLHQRYLISSCQYNAIVAIDKNTHHQEVFIDDISQPLGNCIHDGVFYVSTGNYLKGFDLETGEEVFSVNIPCIQHLDGMSCDENGFLYVIDTGGKIHKVNPETAETTCIVSSGLTTWIQDCVYDKFNNRLLSVGYAVNAPIQAINLETYEVTTATETPFGKYDGISIDQFGNIYLASHYAPGKIIKYQADFSAYEVISSGHIEPAGLEYNQFDNVLVVPNFGGDNVDFIPITVTGFNNSGKTENPLKVYPNPNTGWFRLMLNCSPDHQTDIDIINSNGNLVYGKSLYPGLNDRCVLEFDLSALPGGIYFLRLVGDNKVFSEKVIIR